MVEIMTDTLTQPELGRLYVEMQAPLHFQKHLNNNQLDDNDAVLLHEMLSDQKPDTALISLSLCSIMLANKILSAFQNNNELSLLGTELKYFSIDIVERYGRAWINAADYDGQDKEGEQQLLLESSDNLNALGSIIQEINEICEPFDMILTSLGRLLEYQAYAHANTAEGYIEMLSEEGRLPGKLIHDQIPLPTDLQADNRHMETV